ncbi:MAG: DUF3106 domain-containing protein [Acidobacteriaceae bacterium]
MPQRYITRTQTRTTNAWLTAFAAGTLFVFAGLCPQNAFAAGSRAWGGPHGQRQMEGRPQMQQGQEQRAQNRALRQEHLNQWLRQHQNLPLAEQEKALEREPGFNRLPPQAQNRMRQRLRQLDAMPPERRQRYLNRIEAMERLTPQQRQQVRGAILQYGQLPVDRRRLVGKAFRDLREMPPPQRQAVLNSQRFKGQFSDHERDVLHNLLGVDPYLPAPQEDATQSER